MSSLLVRQGWSVLRGQLKLVTRSRAGLHTSLRPGDKLPHGWTVVGALPVPELGIQNAVHLRHEGKAQWLHMENPTDETNAFSVHFKTVPQDSTGVAHILEHVTLCGSKKYRVRDPFMKMLSRSLATMNAMTGSSVTVMLLRLSFVANFFFIFPRTRLHAVSFCHSEFKGFLQHAASLLGLRFQSIAARRRLPAGGVAVGHGQPEGRFGLERCRVQRNEGSFRGRPTNIWPELVESPVARRHLLQLFWWSSSQNTRPDLGTIARISFSTLQVHISSDPSVLKKNRHRLIYFQPRQCKVLLVWPPAARASLGGCCPLPRG